MEAREAKGQFEEKDSLGKRAQHFVLQMIDQAQGLRYHHDEAKEEGSDIAVIGLDLRQYGIEVKAIQNFLTRDNTGLSSCGELCFEIMSKYKKEPGSLYEWIFPELWTLQHEGKGRPAVRPKRIHYALYGNDATREYPFCVVTFNTASLLSELQAMGKKWGWRLFDLSEWSLDRLKGICNMGGRNEIQLPAAGQYIVKGGSAQETTGFCWYIPLNKIISAAEKITMVGDQPPIVERHRYEKYHPIPGGHTGFQALQQARYDYLLGHSKGAAITNAELKEAEKQAHIYKENSILSW